MTSSTKASYGQSQVPRLEIIGSNTIQEDKIIDIPL